MFARYKHDVVGSPIVQLIYFPLQEEPQARMMAVQYASRIFPQDHVASRYILLLACGDA